MKKTSGQQINDLSAYLKLYHVFVLDCNAQYMIS